ncbi:MAG: protein kinase [Kofleriaceae bacterium]
MAAEADEEEQFGPYLVYERLGVGGMATVHRALERGIEGFERIVALKRLLPHLAEDASFIKAFVREAKLASALNHVNIVQIFELGRVGTEYFISMEYIDGRDIRRILRHARKVTGPPPVHVTVGLLLQLCDALDYAHNKFDENGQPMQLVHRDVSPSNVLVTSAGHVKVIDFGIAKAQSSQLRTQTGRVKGKLAYMAPEAVSGKELDARSDLFAIGVIAHELLTARPLFASKNEYQTLLKVQRGDIMPPSTFNQACPAELDAIVLRALARDPDQRYSGAAELRDDLNALRKQYSLATGVRDIATWLEWAFTLEIPTGGFAGNTGDQPSISMDPRSPVRSRTPARVQAKRSHSEVDDAVEIAWGEDKSEQGPIVLDDVPDVSGKHLVPPLETPAGSNPALANRLFDDEEIDDDIPTPAPSHGRAPSRPTPRPGASSPGATPLPHGGSSGTVAASPAAREKRTTAQGHQPAPTPRAATQTSPEGNSLVDALYAANDAAATLDSMPAADTQPSMPALTPSRTGQMPAIRDVPSTTRTSPMIPAADPTGMPVLDAGMIEPIIPPARPTPRPTSEPPSRASAPNLPAPPSRSSSASMPTARPTPNPTAPAARTSSPSMPPMPPPRATPTPSASRATPNPSAPPPPIPASRATPNPLADDVHSRPTPNPAARTRTMSGASRATSNPDDIHTRPTPNPLDARPLPSAADDVFSRPTPNPAADMFSRSTPDPMGDVEIDMENTPPPRDDVFSRPTPNPADDLFGAAAEVYSRPPLVDASGRPTPNPMPVVRFREPTVPPTSTAPELPVVATELPVGVPLNQQVRTKPGHQPARAKTALPIDEDAPTLSGDGVPVQPMRTKAASTGPAIGEAMLREKAKGPRKSLVIIAGIVAAGAIATAATLWATRGDQVKPVTEASQPRVAPKTIGVVKFNLEPADAEIVIGGQVAHTGSPFQIELEPGVHQVQINRAGYKSWLTALELSASETQTLRVVLEPLGAAVAAAEPEGTLILSSTPSGLEAVLDGKLLPVRTPIKMPIKVGPHTIVLKKDGEEVWRQDLVAQANAEHEFSPSMEAAKQRERAERRAAPHRVAQPAVAHETESPKTEPAHEVPAPPPAPTPQAIAPTISSTTPVTTTASATTATTTTKPAPTTPTTTTTAPTTTTTGAKTTVAPTTNAITKPAPTTTTPTAPPSPPRITGPVTIPPSKVTKISGDVPKLSMTRHAEVPPVVAAKLCIDHKGAVTSADLITKLEARAALEMVQTLKSWRYTPYKPQGSPNTAAACFAVSFRSK